MPDPSQDVSRGPRATLSVVVPCYNETKTLETCIERVLDIEDEELAIEIVIVDDGSTDDSLARAQALAAAHPQVKAFTNGTNQGKGAALRHGFSKATGDFIAVQDADLEYRPADLRRLVVPLLENEADVVLGSRFLSGGTHRVLYFWHSLGNRFLTLLSNMFTDLNLTDMETCYKVFRADIIRSVDIRENRFGFEPEIVAKVAQMKVRIFEMGISYFGRTYAEGKKIGVRDGLRALYCIVRYNAFNAPLPIQFLVYLFIGGIAALVNLAIFLLLLSATSNVAVSAVTAFLVAAAVNYRLCISFLFRHGSRWESRQELLLYAALVLVLAGVDYGCTLLALASGMSAGVAKITATLIMLVLNFLGRRYLVFPERKRGPWKPQEPRDGESREAHAAEPPVPLGDGE